MESLPAPKLANKESALAALIVTRSLPTPPLTVNDELAIEPKLRFDTLTVSFPAPASTVTAPVPVADAPKPLSVTTSLPTPPETLTAPPTDVVAPPVPDTV